MFEGLFSAISGLRVNAQKISNSASNVANVNTDAYKKTRVVAGERGQVGGADVVSVQRLDSAGGYISTGRPMDVAIEGEGYFQVKTKNGMTGYTRAGNFSVNSEGKVVDANGNQVVPEIFVPAGASAVGVSADGTVTGVLNGNNTVFGKLQIARFANPSGMQSAGGNVFLETDASGQPMVGDAGTGQLGKIITSSLETSNVDYGEEVVQQMISQRGHSAAIAAVKTMDNMLGSIIDIKR